VGFFVGYDQPMCLGRDVQGASAALPFFVALIPAARSDLPARPFRVPPGVRLVRVEAETGLLPGPETKTVILEAFMPGTEPTTTSPPKGAAASIAHEVYLSQGSVSTIDDTGKAGTNGTAALPSVAAPPTNPAPARGSAVPRAAAPRTEVRSPPPAAATGSPNTGGLY
jgi:penicillin-binding protein 1A